MNYCKVKKGNNTNLLKLTNQYSILLEGPHISSLIHFCKEVCIRLVVLQSSEGSSRPSKNYLDSSLDKYPNIWKMEYCVLGKNCCILFRVATLLRGWVGNFMFLTNLWSLLNYLNVFWYLLAHHHTWCVILYHSLNNHWFTN